MRIEVIESPTIVVVELPTFLVQAETSVVDVQVESTDVTVVAEPPEHVVVTVDNSVTHVVPEISEIRVIAVAEQGPPGAMTFRPFDAVWEPELLVSWADYDIFRIELAGNTELDFVGAVDAQRVILELTQDEVGGRLVTLPPNVRYGSLLGSVTLSTEPGATDRLGFLYNAATDTYDFMAYARGF